MRKIINHFLLSVIFILIILSVLYFLYYISDYSKLTNEDEQKFFSLLPKTEAKDSDNLPVIKALVSVENNIVSVKQEITLKQMEKSVLAYIPSKSYADTVIKNIYTEEGIESFYIENSNLYINLPVMQKKIVLEYKITLKENKDNLSYSKDKILLSNFLITPGVKKNNEYIKTYTSSFGDPFIYDTNSYDITVRMNKGYTAYAGGKHSENIDGNSRISRFLVDNYRDFSLILCKNSNVKTEKFNDINITYIDSITSKSYVENAISFAQGKFSKYPYKELIVASVPINNHGMEFSGMIYINENSFTNLNLLKSLIYHEVFHQWFYGVLGIDQINEPFLDEGLVTFFASYLTNSLSNSKDFKGGFINKQLRDYPNKSIYNEFAYQDSSKYFNYLYQAFGQDEFFKRIKKIFDDKAFTIISFDDLKGYFTK